MLRLTCILRSSKELDFYFEECKLGATAVLLVALKMLGLRVDQLGREFPDS